MNLIYFAIRKVGCHNKGDTRFHEVRFFWMYFPMVTIDWFF